MIKILIVEDNYTQIISLKKLIQDIIPNSYIDIAQAYKDAICLIEKNSDYDIFYLDISLSENENDPNGLDIGSKIRNKKNYSYTPIIFITSSGHLIGNAVNSIHCHSFLTKPYALCDVEKSLKDILNSSILKEKPIIFKSSDNIKFKVYPSEIIYITSSDHGVTITTTSYSFNTRQFIMDTIISNLSEDFFRCHKKYIINVTHIDNYDKISATIHLKHAVIPVGRKYKNTFEKEYL